MQAGEAWSLWKLTGNYRNQFQILMQALPAKSQPTDTGVLGPWRRRGGGVVNTPRCEAAAFATETPRDVGARQQHPGLLLPDTQSFSSTSSQLPSSRVFLPGKVPLPGGKSHISCADVGRMGMGLGATGTSYELISCGMVEMTRAAALKANFNLVNQAVLQWP